MFGYRSDSKPSGSGTQPPETVLDSEALKEQGNKAFKASRWGEAVDWYTKAIGGHPFHLSSNTYSLVMRCRKQTLRTDILLQPCSSLRVPQTIPQGPRRLPTSHFSPGSHHARLTRRLFTRTREYPSDSEDSAPTRTMPVSAWTAYAGAQHPFHCTFSRPDECAG